MRIKTFLKYLEVLLLVSAILTPVIFYFTPLSILERHASFSFNEGDLIQVIIHNYEFDYDPTGLESFNVTPGLSLYPVFNIPENNTEPILDVEEILYGLKLFEGDSTSDFVLNFRVDIVHKDRRTGITSGYIILEETGRKFLINALRLSAINPSVSPFLALGLTISYESGSSLTEYICWHNFDFFSTENTREALNWHSRNQGFNNYNYAREDKNTFISVYNGNYLGHQFSSLTTIILQAGTNRIQRISSTYTGYQQMLVDDGRGQFGFYNFTVSPDILSYWEYNLDMEFKYFRGGYEI